MIRDRHGNFIFVDILGIGSELTVVPYQHFKTAYCWLVCVMLPLNKKYFFQVAGHDPQEAAEKGCDAYVRYRVEQEELKRILREKAEEIKEADSQYEKGNKKATNSVKIGSKLVEHDSNS